MAATILGVSLNGRPLAQRMAGLDPEQAMAKPYFRTLEHPLQLLELGHNATCSDTGVPDSAITQASKRMGWLTVVLVGV